MRRWSRLGAAAALVASTAVAAVPAGAAACVFDVQSATVLITVGQDEAITIARSGDQITLDGASCGGTVQDTNTIAISATGRPTSVTIDLGGGAFAPGATPEGDGGTSEIEFIADFPAGAPLIRVTGGPGGDAITVGDDGINLDATEPVGDADVAIGNAPVEIVGGDGGDVLSVAGGAGTGGPHEATLRGGADGDLFLGAGGGSTVQGGDGPDTLEYTDAPVGVVADLGAGTVEVGADTDAISEIENLAGSTGDDTIVGDGGNNVLHGGGGDDVIEGAAGADVLSGGNGTDTARFSGTDGVEVDLREGTATGQGADTLAEIENVAGTDGDDAIHGDDLVNVLAGGDGADDVFGHGGRDEVGGGDGGDELVGQEGNDLVEGGPGPDALDGGRGRGDLCKGGTDPDSFVRCERIVPGPQTSTGG